MEGRPYYSHLFHNDSMHKKIIVLVLCMNVPIQSKTLHYETAPTDHNKQNLSDPLHPNEIAKFISSRFIETDVQTM